MQPSTGIRPKTRFQARLPALALAAALLSALPAAAHDDGPRYSRPSPSSGHVEIVKSIPGGVISVGGAWGTPPAVVVEPRPEVVVVREREQCPPKRVIIVREERPREVVIIKKHGHGGHTRRVIVEDGERMRHRRGEGRGWGRDHRDRDDRRDDRQESYQENNGHERIQYYRNGDQVSEIRQDATGNYQYYEDAGQVSIQDNRNGRNRVIQIRK